MADTKFMSFAEVTPSLSDSVLVANDTNGVRRAKLENIKEAIGATAAACGGIVAASLGQNGYVKFANGFTIQWGFCHCNEELHYPIDYAVTAYGIVATVVSTKSGSGATWNVVSDQNLHNSKSLYQFFTNGAQDAVVHWVSIGR